MMRTLLKAGPIIFLTATIAFGILYRTTYAGIFLTLAITFGTTAYHFIMRWLVAFAYDFIMDNKADYRKHWYQVGQWEQRFYEKLHVKRWKKHMPTYAPDLFDPRKHTWVQIAQATCQAELGHETIAVLSFVPIVAGIWFGEYPVFILTSIAAAIFDLMFAVMQRYNRQRIVAYLTKERMLGHNIN